MIHPQRGMHEAADVNEEQSYLLLSDTFFIYTNMLQHYTYCKI